ncbi:MAG: ABC transporter ATP-binding protein [Pseudomonadota bacterium]
MLELRDIRKSFDTPDGPLPILEGVSLSLARGESLALTGESGSGKSTLLHIAAGLEPADGGEALIDGERADGLSDAAAAALRRSRIGLVFQQFNLVPSLTVEANIRLQARLAGREAPEWTRKLIASLGLDGLEGRYPEQLSGGQQQRVAVARALAPRPDLVLADEPTGNLDEATGDRVLDVALELAAETGAALMMVTHSERVAARLDRRVRLHAGRLE